LADVNKIELAYLAGFFDGKGSVGIYTRKYSVNITNCDPRVLQEFQKHWGGKIHTMKWYEFTRQDKYVWQLYGHNSRSFLEAILPYVISKKTQIEIYLATLDVAGKGHQGKKYTRSESKIISANALELKRLKKEVG